MYTLERRDTPVNEPTEMLDENRKDYSCKDSLKYYLTHYCTISSIHGFRYFGENRTWLEKCFWLSSIGVSLYFCIQFIISVYIKWDQTPVIVSFSTKETPIWQIPFPSITICPESKTTASIFNYTHYLYKKEDNESLSEEEETKFGYLSFVCNTKLALNYTASKFAGEDFYQFLENVQPNFYKNALDCKYLGVQYNCSDLFVPIITDDGICYTFNIMDRSQMFTDEVVHYKDFHKTIISHDWGLEHGYRKEVGVEAYPRRGLFGGIPYGLQISLSVHEDVLDYTCGTSIKGFKVRMTHPQTIPRVRRQHLLIPLDKVVHAGVSADMMTTSEPVKSYKPNRRNCYFPAERSLKYFKLYSQDNCGIECRANFTLQECGCLPFSSPRIKSEKICGSGSIKCLETSLKHYQGHRILQKRGKDEHSVRCNCLPICTTLNFNIESTQADWDWRTTFKCNQRKDIDYNDKKVHVSMLHVYYKAKQFISSERNELYGTPQALANIGGLLGLFIGFSALSMVEILYYLSLRIICNMTMFGPRNWSGQRK